MLEHRKQRFRQSKEDEPSHKHCDVRSDNFNDAEEVQAMLLHCRIIISVLRMDFV